MKIVADENMPLVEELFRPWAEDIVRLPGRSLSAADVQDADVLLVRSVTRVNADLLSGSRVRFVGSATIGTDHIDQEWLAGQGIRFAHSPGCNAEAVVDYVLSAVQHLTAEGCPLTDRVFGVVGCGNVGGRLCNRLERMGISYVPVDPPRARCHSDRDYGNLQDLRNCDVICLHTPLTTEGEDATTGMINARVLQYLKPGTLIVSAGRGEVINEHDLASFPELILAMDVWAGEPSVDRKTFARAQVSTPHIAGYSLDGKIRGTWMLHTAVAGWAGKQGGAEPVSHEGIPEPLDLSSVSNPNDALRLCISAVYDVADDSTLMRSSFAGAGTERWPAIFDGLRRSYPVRREFSALRVTVSDRKVSDYLAGAGFTVVPMA